MGVAQLPWRRVTELFDRLNFQSESFGEETQGYSNQGAMINVADSSTRLEDFSDAHAQ